MPSFTTQALSRSSSSYVVLLDLEPCLHRYFVVSVSQSNFRDRTWLSSNHNHVGIGAPSFQSHSLTSEIHCVARHAVNASNRQQGERCPPRRPWAQRDEFCSPPECRGPRRLGLPRLLHRLLLASGRQLPLPLLQLQRRSVQWAVALDSASFSWFVANILQIPRALVFSCVVHIVHISSRELARERSRDSWVVVNGWRQDDDAMQWERSPVLFLSELAALDFSWVSWSFAETHPLELLVCYPQSFRRYI